MVFRYLGSGSGGGGGSGCGGWCRRHNRAAGCLLHRFDLTGLPVPQSVAAQVLIALDHSAVALIVASSKKQGY